MATTTAELAIPETTKTSRTWRFLLGFAKRNPLATVAAMILILIIVSAVAAPVLAPGDPANMMPADRLQSPADAGWLGTDVFGRDVLSRILYGTRISLGVGVVSVLVASAIGTLLGLIAGYSGGWQDYITMR